MLVKILNKYLLCSNTEETKTMEGKLWKPQPNYPLNLQAKIPLQKRFQQTLADFSIQLHYTLNVEPSYRYCIQFQILSFKTKRISLRKISKYQP